MQRFFQELGFKKAILQHFVASFGCYRPKIITYFCPFLTCLRHEILHVIHTQQGDIAQKILSLLALIFLKKTDLILVLGMVQNFQNFEFMLQKNYLVYHFEILRRCVMGLGLYPHNFRSLCGLVQQLWPKNQFFNFLDPFTMFKRPFMPLFIDAYQ